MPVAPSSGVHRIGGVTEEEAGITGWLIDYPLERDDETALLAGYCDRLAAAGVPLLRVATASEVFRPTLDAMTRRWVRGRGVELEEITRERAEAAGGEEWRRSPFYQLVEVGAKELRRHNRPGRRLTIQRVRVSPIA